MPESTVLAEFGISKWSIREPYIHLVLVNITRTVSKVSRCMIKWICNYELFIRRDIY